MNLRWFFLFFYLIAIQTLPAQNPGNVSTNLTLWLKGNYTTGSGPANKMKFGSSNYVEEWRNEKSSYILAQTTTTKQPRWYNGSSNGVVSGSSDSLNYNPHVKFNYSATVANASLLANSNTSTDLLGTAGTIIMVLTDDNAFRTAITYYSNTVYRYQIKQTFRSQTSDGVAILSPINTTPSYRVDFGASSYNSPISNARIVVSRGFGNTLSVRRNGTSIGTNTYEAGYCPGIVAGINLGGNPGVSSNEPYNGRFGEVILYNTNITDADVRKIESYLAVKYGITLNPAGLDAVNGYVNSAGSTIYSQGSNGTTYWNNIIGLGRDDNSGLVQKQAHTYDDSVKVFISTLAASNPANAGTITDNNDFLMVGATTGLLMEHAATHAEKPSGVSIRLDREWKVINTGFNQSFTFQVKPSGSASNNFKGGGILQLLADDDGNFSNATIITSGNSGVTISYSSDIITVTINPSASGGIFPINGTPKFITIGALNSTLPDEAITFTCTKLNNSVVSKWAFNADQTIERYELEKSTDLSNWITLTTRSAGSSGTQSLYEFKDEQFLQTSFYRVKAVSKTGIIQYSSTRKIQLNPYALSVQVFPNPATTAVNLRWENGSKPTQIDLFSADGRKHSVQMTLSHSGAILQVQSLPKGLYMLVLSNADETATVKFFKQ
jgi:hypothetical protein